MPKFGRFLVVHPVYNDLHPSLIPVDPFAGRMSGKSQVTCRLIYTVS